MNNSKTTHTVSDFNANSLNYYYFDERGKPVVRSLADIERDIIEGALSLYDDNILKAASFLEVSPSTIYRKKNGWEQREIKH
jgi:two-component system repressor protein LuxO